MQEKNISSALNFLERVKQCEKYCKLTDLPEAKKDLFEHLVNILPTVKVVWRWGPWLKK